MKKVSLILLLFWLASIRLGFAQVVLSLPDISGEQGSMANIPITLNRADGILGAAISFTYDSTILTKTSITPIDGFVLEDDQSAAGVIKFTMKADRALSGEMNLVTISFDVIGMPGSMSELKFDKVDLTPMPSNMRTNDGKFTVLSNPDIVLDSLNLNFSNNEDNEIEIDSQVLRSVQISNNGSAPLEVHEIKLIGNTANEFRIESDNENLPRTLSPFSDTLKIAVSCSPHTTGFKDDTLQIFSDDPDENPVNVLLTGNAVPKPIIEVSRKFIRIPLGEDTAHVHISNIGGGRLKWKARPSQNWFILDPDEGNLRKEDGVVQAKIMVNREGVCEGDTMQSIEISDGSHVDHQAILLIVAIDNPAPEPLFDSDDIDINFNNVGKTLPLPLDSIFSDAKGDLLTFFLLPNSNSNPGVAEAVVSGNTLKITSRANGTTNITVSASDNCDTTMLTLEVRVIINQPPIIRHTPPSAQVNTGEAILLQAVIENDQVGTTVILHYRKGGEKSYTQMLMETRGGGIYDVGLPNNGVTPAGVEYYLSARNFKGRSLSPNPQPTLADSSFYSVRVRASGEGIAKNNAQPAGNTQLDYRLISIPLDLDDKSAAKVFEDDLGKYDNTKWRFFELRDDYINLPLNQKIYKEFPGLSAMTPGKAFWLLVKEPGKVIDTGAGISLPTNAAYSLPLHRGWNLIGNPFNFSIPVTKIRLPGQNKVPIRAYRGVWNDPVANPVEELLPFEGYAVYDSLEVGGELVIDPDLTVTSNARTQAHTPNYDENILYSIRLLAQCQDARDIDNLALVSREAAINQDILDQPEPLVIGEYVAVYFHHRDWPTAAKIYCIDARPEPTDGEIWDFEVRTNIRDKVRLTFANLESVPGEFEVWVMDQALNLSHNLRESNVYTIAGTEHPKRLQLVVGKRDFVAEKRTAVERTPATYELSQNFPNPFNPSTTIRYGLPRAERVTVTIYSTLGEEIVTLIDEELQRPGYHVAIWDGRNRAGHVVASGIYLYKFQAGGFASIKKMALVR